MTLLELIHLQKHGTTAERRASIAEQVRRWEAKRKLKRRSGASSKKTESAD